MPDKMYTLTCNIKLGNYIFTQTTRVEIKRSANLIGDTASIEMPLRFKFENNRRATTEKTIKRGDTVEIWLGYDFDNKPEFEGYVQSVSAKDNTALIQCEDKTFLLRRNLTNTAFKTARLRDVLVYIVKNTGLTLNDAMPDVDISGFVLKNVTGLQALEKLKQEYGLSIFMDYSGRLYAGLGMLYDTGEVSYDLSKNVVSPNLTFRNADEIRMKVKAISILKSNQKLEVETGDSDGEIRTLYTSGIESAKQLKEWAEREIEKYKYTGYEGSFETFLLPDARYGMKCNLYDENYPERAGSYLIESVTTTFGTSGARRIIELGIKL